MLITELALERLNMSTTADMVPGLPQHIKAWSMAKKLDWLVNLVQPIVAELYIACEAPQMDTVNINLNVCDQIFSLNIPADMQGQELELSVNNKILKVHIPAPPPKYTETTDQLYNSSLGFLRSMMEFHVLSDVICAGDIDRLPACLKRLCTTFIGLTSFESKYAIECVNFITKTEWVLSVKESVKAKLRCFVNTAGKAGKNKPADMQQENNIKIVKNVLRGLGAGKTDTAMSRASKAAPAINEISAKFQEGIGVHMQPTIFEHHKKKSDEDKDVVMNELRQSHPFAVHAGRNIGLVASSFPAGTVNQYKFVEFLKRNSGRAVNQCDFQQ